MTTPPHEESTATHTIMSSGLEEEDSDREIGKMTTHPMNNALIPIMFPISN